MRKAILVLLVGFLLAGLTLGCAAEEPTAPKVINLNAGSTSVTSGIYVYAVAVARAINKYAPDINVTVIESGATYDDIRRIREGVFDMGLCDGWDGVLDAYRGLETFKGDPYPEIRLFWMREVTYRRFYVRADTGIKTWSDLAGKKYSPGVPGSGTEAQTRRINDVLGTGIDLVPASLSDAIKLIKDRAIVGITKAGPADRMDSAMLEAHTLTPLTVIGLTKEQADTVNDAYPFYLFGEYKKGSIKELPEVGGFLGVTAPTGVTVSSRLPQDVGYRIVKAVYENWGEIQSAYSGSSLFKDPLTPYFEVIPEHLAVPFHAGVVQYCKENGIAIPDYFIPPEYKP